MNELRHKFGSEIRFSIKDITYFAFRHGRHIEHETKGNRNYQTFGYGVGIYGILLDYMHIIDDDNELLDGAWSITIGYCIKLD